MDISLNQLIQFLLNNTLNLRPLTTQIISCYTHKMAIVVTSFHSMYRRATPAYVSAYWWRWGSRPKDTRVNLTTRHVGSRDVWANITGHHVQPSCWCVCLVVGRQSGPTECLLHTCYFCDLWFVVKLPFVLDIVPKCCVIQSYTLPEIFFPKRLSSLRPVIYWQ